jgi:hypothetical protein
MPPAATLEARYLAGASCDAVREPPGCWWSCSSGDSRATASRHALDNRLTGGRPAWPYGRRPTDRARWNLWRAGAVRSADLATTSDCGAGCPERHARVDHTSRAQYVELINHFGFDDQRHRARPAGVWGRSTPRGRPDRSGTRRLRPGRVCPPPGGQHERGATTWATRHAGKAAMPMCVAEREQRPSLRRGLPSHARSRCCRDDGGGTPTSRLAESYDARCYRPKIRQRRG